MTDQKNDAEEARVYDVPLYREDEKTAPASKDSNNDYSMLSMSTLKKDGVYASISSGQPATSKEVKKSPKATNYRRMVCCLAASAGVAILVICCENFHFASSLGYLKDSAAAEA
jgi:hypothetical protein